MNIRQAVNLDYLTLCLAGWVMTMNKGKELIAKAKEYLGKGGAFVWTFFGLAKGTAWCAAFVCYCFWKKGWKKHIYGGKPVFYVPYLEEWLHEHAQHVKMTEAKAGDIIIMTWTGGGNNARKKGTCSRDHVGLIRTAGTSTVANTIEGNTSGGIVANRARPLTYVFAIYRPSLFAIKQAKKESKQAAKKSAAQKKGKAIDISAWQGKISAASFKDVKAAGYDTVILRSSYTSQGSFTLHRDKVFEHNARTAKKAGLKIGVYHYSQALSKAEARKEARFVLDTIKGFDVTEGVAFDYEAGGRLNSSSAAKIGRKGCTAIAAAFCTEINAGGYEALVYANYSWFTSVLYKDEVKKFAKIWLAHYADAPGFKDYYMWQYTSSGNVPGISGRIDCNEIKCESIKVTVTPTKKKAYTGKLPTKTQHTGSYDVTNTKRWQKFLNWYFGKVLTVDGIYGPKTEEYTRKFQRKVFKAYREIDGIAGPKTINKASQAKK